MREPAHFGSLPVGLLHFFPLSSSRIFSAKPAVLEQATEGYESLKSSELSGNIGNHDHLQHHLKPVLLEGSSGLSPEHGRALPSEEAALACFGFSTCVRLQFHVPRQPISPTVGFGRTPKTRKQLAHHGRRSPQSAEWHVQKPHATPCNPSCLHILRSQTLES